MRADRLIAMLMLLQTHTRMTSVQLARELEVSPRTVYRDAVALNAAGIPVYTERGPGGGIALVESYRTNLTGMDEREAQALFMLTIPEALVELGVGQELKAAMRKLVAALPHGQRMRAIQAQQRIHLDPNAWEQAEERLVHLSSLYDAVWQDKMLSIVFQGSFDAEIEIEIAPLGLVSKLSTWYFMGETDGYIRVVRVKDILRVKVLEREFVRDPEFNLAERWVEWCNGYKKRRFVYQARVRISAEVYDRLPLYLGEGVRFEAQETQGADVRGWKEVIISYENIFKARESILSLGRAVEVLEPQALRCSVVDFARQIVDLYQPTSAVN